MHLQADQAPAQTLPHHTNCLSGSCFAIRIDSRPNCATSWPTPKPTYKQCLQQAAQAPANNSPHHTIPTTLLRGAQPSARRTVNTATIIVDASLRHASCPLLDHPTNNAVNKLHSTLHRDTHHKHCLAHTAPSSALHKHLHPTLLTNIPRLSIFLPINQPHKRCLTQAAGSQRHAAHLHSPVQPRDPSKVAPHKLHKPYAEPAETLCASIISNITLHLSVDTLPASSYIACIHYAQQQISHWYHTTIPSLPTPQAQAPGTASQSTLWLIFEHHCGHTRAQCRTAACLQADSLRSH
jgi:hypothetical protein